MRGFIITILMLGSVTINAQNLVFSGGVSVSKQEDIYHSPIYGDKDYGNGFRSNIQFGISSELNVGKSKIYIQPLLKIIGKGTSREKLVTTGPDPEDFIITDLYRKIIYIGVYPGILFKQPIGKNFDLNISVFPYFAYATSGEERIPFVEGSNNIYVNTFHSSPKKIEFKDDFKRGDVGAGISLGATIYQRFMTTINYEQGFSDIVDGEEITVKNRSFGLTLGYVFKL